MGFRHSAVLLEYLVDMYNMEVTRILVMDVEVHISYMPLKVGIKDELVHVVSCAEKVSISTKGQSLNIISDIHLGIGPCFHFGEKNFQYSDSTGVLVVVALC